NAMVIFDPKEWSPIQIFKLHERDDLPRSPTPHAGYEDMRLFKTDAGGLQGIAASLHLKRGRAGDGTGHQVLGPFQLGPQSQPPEQVLLSFDDEYNIVGAEPIRGEGWSGTPQKNWVPFDDCAEPRFLYSIGKGTMFDVGGSVHGDRALVKPSLRSSSAIFPARVPAGNGPRAAPPEPIFARRDERKSKEPDPGDRGARSRRPDLRMMVRGGDVRIVRGKRSISPALVSPRPLPRPVTVSRGGSDSTRMLGSGRILLPRYEGLRGGTQLVRVDDEAWLGIGHEMKFVNGKKYYWHVFYLVDSQGLMRAVSEPMK